MTVLAIALAGLGAFCVLAAACMMVVHRRRRRSRYEQARRRQFVNQAAVWHGYPPAGEPLPPVPSLPRLHLRYAMGEEPIPPGLHAQHVLAGTERAHGRQRTEAY